MHDVADVAVITLPRPAGCPLLHTKSRDLRGKVFSLRLDRSGRLDELAALLEAQKPRVLVVSALHRMTGRDVQRVTDLAFRHCPDVSIVGSYASTNWGETFTVRVSGAVRSFCLMDTAMPQGSMRGNDVIVYGALDRLDLLNISADCRVHMSGVVSPATNTCIRARQLTINGQRVPVTSPPTGDPPTYMFKSMPQLPQPTQLKRMTQLGHPRPRRALPPGAVTVDLSRCAV